LIRLNFSPIRPWRSFLQLKLETPSARHHQFPTLGFEDSLFTSASILTETPRCQRIVAGYGKMSPLSSQRLQGVLLKKASLSAMSTCFLQDKVADPICNQAWLHDGSNRPLALTRKQSTGDVRVLSARNGTAPSFDESGRVESLPTSE